MKNNQHFFLGHGQFPEHVAKGEFSLYQTVKYETRVHEKLQCYPDEGRELHLELR